MKKIFLLILFVMALHLRLNADEGPANDQEFLTALDSVKNPFEDGLPKPVVVIPKVVYQPPPKPKPVAIIIPKPKPKKIFEVVSFPKLHLAGVLVGDEMHEAIINDTIVPLGGMIAGVKVVSVAKEGVTVTYKGKKMFLKVD